MKFWAQSILAVSIATFSYTAQADIIGVYASADYWDLQGDYNEALHGRAMNDDKALDWDNKGQAQMAVSFEHPVPLIPNVRLRYVGIEAESEQKHAATDASIYETKLNNTDFIAYYEILDNIVSVDVGVAAKRLDGDVTYLSSEFTKDKLKISETAPMVYGAVGGKLPFTGLSAKAELLATSYSDVKITDVSAEVKYDFVDTLLLDVGAKAGYRMLDIELDDQDRVDTQFKFHGPYVGLEAHF